MKKPTFDGYDWTVKDIHRVWDVVRKCAEKRNLDFYEPQIEIISDKEMLEMYTYSLPIGYPHWSFGASYDQNIKQYEKQPHHLAYEIVCNTDPSVCYIMGSNTLAQQILVIAHAAVGHSNIFKNNVYFKNHTDAKNILNVLVSFKQYILDCEAKYGEDEVEQIIDCGHALAGHSINRGAIIRDYQEEKVVQKRSSYHDHIIDQLIKPAVHKKKSTERDEDNLLSYICQTSQFLPDWKKNILLTLQYIAQYFYPQIKTKVLNEGFATGVERLLYDDLYEAGIISTGMMVESLCDSCAVRWQQGSFYEHHGMWGGGSILELYEVPFNPYALGYNILRDIKRACENPTEEDRKHYGDFVNQPFLDVWKEACWNYDDSGYIHQFLSPKVIRDMKLAAVFDDTSLDYYVVDHIAIEEDYTEIKSLLSKQISRQRTLPEIKIVSDNSKTREMILTHEKRQGIGLYTPYAEQCCEMIRYLLNYSSVTIKEVK